VRIVRVPFIAETGGGFFGYTEFIYDGQKTVQGLPVYRSDYNVWRRPFHEMWQ
jgi:hypothetical protein